MKSTHYRTHAKRAIALRQSRRNPVDPTGGDIPSVRLNNYFIKIGATYYLLACGTRPDRAHRAKLEQDAVVMQAEKKKRLAESVEAERQRAEVREAEKIRLEKEAAENGGVVPQLSGGRRRRIFIPGLAALAALAAAGNRRR